MRNESMKRGGLYRDNRICCVLSMEERFQKVSFCFLSFKADRNMIRPWPGWLFIIWTQPWLIPTAIRSLIHAQFTWAANNFQTVPLQAKMFAVFCARLYSILVCVRGMRVFFRGLLQPTLRSLPYGSVRREVTHQSTALAQTCPARL